jgi:membrane-bound lytic murein transglycosylase D
MSFIQMVSGYIGLNLIVILGFSFLWVVAKSVRRFGFFLPARTELKLHYFVLSLIAGFALVQPFVPRPNVFATPLKVWAAPSIKSFNVNSAKSSDGGYMKLSTKRGAMALPIENLSIGIRLLLAALVLVILSIVLIDLRKLLKIKRESFLIKKIGTVQIFASDKISVPFSFWLPFQNHIVMPSELLSRPLDFRMAVVHEICHHRQGDTRWVYFLLVLKSVCFLNPVIHFWNRWISEIQEFACDETLVDRKNVESQAYARCLVQVAQTAINQKRIPVCATGMAFSIDRNLLKRRIEKMFTKQLKQISPLVLVAFGFAVFFTMSLTVYAANALVQDRRITIEQAQTMADRANQNETFPVVVNEAVLAQLNRFLGTPEGREYIKASLARMQIHKPMVEAALQRYGLPNEIMALPIIESGYQNLLESKNTAWPTWKSAGVWQFIRETAKNYGLIVKFPYENATHDQRLDVPLATDAAMRYLLSNNLRFKDWQLAVLAYNMGSTALQKGIDKIGSRDAWVLIKNGVEGDKAYLAKAMAAILIMRNPEIVN